MSIASEYAARSQAPTFQTDGDLAKAWVTNDGGLYLPSSTLTPAEALKLAEWIQRTFGEGT